jgi:hypothetical protein
MWSFLLRGQCDRDPAAGREPGQGHRYAKCYQPGGELVPRECPGYAAPAMYRAKRPQLVQRSVT